MKKFLIIVLFSLYADLSYSQASFALADTITAGFQDSVFQDDTLYGAISIYNVGNSTYQGDIEVVMAIDSFSGSFTYVRDTIVGAVINPFDTISYNFLQPAGTSTSTPPGPFRIGTNVIVIWPAAVGNPGVNTVDTVRDTVTVVEALSIVDIEYQSIPVYPNPVSGQLFFKKDDIEEVRIYSVDGKLVLQCGPNDTELSNLAPCMYTIIVRTTEGLRGRARVIKR